MMPAPAFRANSTCQVGRNVWEDLAATSGDDADRRMLHFGEH
ncbi:hypothetical protein EDD90_3024 [Streptomyces sp. Ag109_O5-1]|nr:hypothetical protein EDD90_3024 [Streptomyces sp. Ag109_O5-1]